MSRISMSRVAVMRVRHQVLNVRVRVGGPHNRFLGRLHDGRQHLNSCGWCGQCLCGQYRVIRSSSSTRINRNTRSTSRALSSLISVCPRSKRKRRTTLLTPNNHSTISLLWNKCPQGRSMTSSPLPNSERQIAHSVNPTKGDLVGAMGPDALPGEGMRTFLSLLNLDTRASV
jgi:hypothetical protein